MALRVRFADGARGLDLEYAGHTVDGGTLLGAVLLGHGLLPSLPAGDYSSALVHLIRED